MGDEYQFVPATAEVLVLDQLSWALTPVAYRSGDGELLWDLQYFLDELPGKSNKILDSFKSLIRSKELLQSGLHLHCRSNDLRQRDNN